MSCQPTVPVHDDGTVPVHTCSQNDSGSAAAKDRIQMLHQQQFINFHYLMKDPIMKLSTAIFAVTITSVAAFNPASTVSSAIRSNASFAARKKTLVQPISLDGRAKKEQFVSVFFVFLYFFNLHRCVRTGTNYSLAKRSSNLVKNIMCLSHFRAVYFCYDVNLLRKVLRRGLELEFTLLGIF